MTKKLSDEEKRELNQRLIDGLRVTLANRKVKTEDNSVRKRLEILRDMEIGVVEPKKVDVKPKKQKSDLLDTARARNKNEKDMDRIGLSPKDMHKDKMKDKDKTKEKEKDPVKQQEARMKEAFSKITLPSGMEIHQEGPQWVLVSKDGKQRSDITDVMNSIDKYNRKVDEANGVDTAQAAAQAQVDKKADPMKADAQVTEKAGRIAPLLADVKDTSGNPVFDPQDLQKVAETGIQHSQELALLERLEKDPKFVEKLKDREKKNQREADDRAMRGVPVNEGR